MRRNDLNALQLDQKCIAHNKVIYLDELEAKTAMTGMKAKGKTITGCYQCSFCRGWHLTSKGAKKLPKSNNGLTEKQVRAIVREEVARALAAVPQPKPWWRKFCGN